jgi:hypothetical protein
MYCQIALSIAAGVQPRRRQGRRLLVKNLDLAELTAGDNPLYHSVHICGSSESAPTACAVPQVA